MRKIDVFTAVFLTTVFVAVLYEGKILRPQKAPEQKANATSNASGLISGLFEEDLEKKFEEKSSEQKMTSGTPFQSRFCESVPDEFITKPEMSLDPEIMRADMKMKMRRLEDRLGEELEAFRQQKDAFGKDRAEYEALKEKHRKLWKEAWNKNYDNVKKVRDEYRDAQDKGLR